MQMNKTLFFEGKVRGAMLWLALACVVFLQQFFAHTAQAVEGVYTTFDGRACTEMSLMNITDKELQLYARNHGQNTSATVFSGEKPMKIAPCVKGAGNGPVDISFLIQGTGRAHFKPVFRLYDEEPAKCQDVGLEMSVIGRPEPRGIDGLKLGLAILKAAIDLIKFNPYDPGSYYAIYDNAKSIYAANQNTEFRQVPDAMYLLPVASTGFQRLDRDGNSNSVATYRMQNDQVPLEKQLVVQLMSLRRNGKDDKEVTIANYSSNRHNITQHGTLMKNSRINVVIMTYEQWKKATAKAIMTFDGNERDRYETWFRNVCASEHKLH